MISFPSTTHPLAILTSSYLSTIPILCCYCCCWWCKKEEKKSENKIESSKRKSFMSRCAEKLTAMWNVMQITVNIKWTQLLENDIKTLSPLFQKFFFIHFMANEMCKHFWYWTLFNEFCELTSIKGFLLLLDTGRGGEGSFYLWKMA